MYKSSDRLRSKLLLFNYYQIKIAILVKRITSVAQSYNSIKTRQLYTGEKYRINHLTY